MSIVNAKEIMMVAAKEKYAVGAFNITDLVQMEAVVEAAVAKKAPLIIQTSVKPTKFLGVNVLVAIYRTIAEQAPIPICLHLDHCTEIEHCKKCLAFAEAVVHHAQLQQCPGQPFRAKDFGPFLPPHGRIPVAGGTPSGRADCLSPSLIRVRSAG